MIEPKDKRTKIWKDWNKRQLELKRKFNKETNEIEVEYKEEKGLGDKVEQALNHPILKPIVEAAKKIIWKDGKDCGCSERKIELNKKGLPGRAQALRCMTEEQHKIYGEFKKEKDLYQQYPQEYIKPLVDMYAHIFALQYQVRDLCANCAGAYNIMKKIEKRIDVVYNSYEV